MEIGNLINNPPAWASGSGKYPEIAMNSHIQLARNLEPFRFPGRANQKELEEILEYVSNHLRSIRKILFPLSRFSPLERKLLIERHIISEGLTRKTIGRGFGVFNKEAISVMVNEEDHLRIRCASSGLSIKSTYKELDKVDESFSRVLPYAFSPGFGYLTACLTNMGTGLRASVFMHLPALVQSGKIKTVFEKLSQIGFLVRGFHNEGTSGEGSFFEISNRTTLGRKEEEIIDTLHKTVLQLVKYENRAREILLKNAKVQIEDKVWRAHSILKNARLLSVSEFINLSSAIRLGVGLGLIKDVKLSTLNKLLVFAQSAHLQKLMGDARNPAQRDIQRATYVRENIDIR
jgi:protein arginine kinase